MAVAERPRTPFDEDFEDENVKKPCVGFSDRATQITGREDNNLILTHCLLYEILAMEIDSPTFKIF